MASPATSCNCSPTGSTASQLQELIADFYENLPEGMVAQGLAVGVVNGVDSSGAPNVTRCYSGYAHVKDQKPIDKHTKFEIGSVTKTFTTTMLAVASQLETVDLSQTAQYYYDQLGIPLTLPVWDPTGANVPMTLLDLADFTSGIGTKDPNNRGLPNEYSVELMHTYLTGLGTLPSEPGTEYFYVNTNFGILAELLIGINQVKDYKHALRGLLDYLGLRMLETGVIESNAPLLPHLAHGYRADGKVEKDYALSSWPAFQGAGAIYSTLDDMLTWLQFNMGLTGGDWSSLLGVLHQVQFPAGGQYGEGLGWFVREKEGITVVEKDGGTSGFHAWIGFTPGSPVGAVLLCNSALVESDGKSPLDHLGERILATLSS